MVNDYKRSKIRLENGTFLGLYLKKIIGKKIRVENRKLLGKYLKEGHREFGVPGNVTLQKSPGKR